MAKQIGKIDLTLANLEEEYQLCLADYDRVLGEIATIIEANKVFESQLH